MRQIQRWADAPLGRRVWFCPHCTEASEVEDRRCIVCGVVTDCDECGEELSFTGANPEHPVGVCPDGCGS